MKNETGGGKQNEADESRKRDGAEIREMNGQIAAQKDETERGNIGRGKINKQFRGWRVIHLSVFARPPHSKQHDQVNRTFLSELCSLLCCLIIGKKTSIFHSPNKRSAKKEFS
jgi:hypothetical protein